MARFDILKVVVATAWVLLGAQSLAAQSSPVGLDTESSVASLESSKPMLSEEVEKAEASTGRHPASPSQRQHAERAASLIIGIFLTIALFNAVFYFGFDRQLAFLFLALYSLIHVAKMGLVFSVRHSADAGMIGHDFAVQAMHLSAYLGSLFLVAFLLGHFAIPRLRLWLLSLLVLAVLAFWMQLRAAYILLAMILAFALTGYAVRKRREGAVLSLVGLIGYAVFSFLGNRQIVDFGYFVGTLFFIMCMTLSFGRQFIRRNQLHQTATLRAARLENQLLKKNIQPHFVMNSLMSLQELFMKDARKAGELIEALAEEFRIFSQAAGDTLVGIEDELALCRAHLKIMGFRKNAGFTLETRGIEGRERIPPGVLHTLVENGITHGFANRKRGRFVLTQESVNGGIRYTLFNDGEQDGEHGRHGTGLKYVAARLEESYPGSWKLDSRSVEKGWEVRIEIAQANHWAKTGQ